MMLEDLAIPGIVLNYKNSEYRHMRGAFEIFCIKYSKIKTINLERVTNSSFI